MKWRCLLAYLAACATSLQGVHAYQKAVQPATADIASFIPHACVEHSRCALVDGGSVYIRSGNREDD